ncbi:MAG: carbohydrate kinase family protein [Thermomicrobiaceae bacterium]
MSSGSNRRPHSVGAFGMLTWDQLLQLDRFPVEGQYHVVKESIEQSGGTTGNMGVALARIGVNVSIASRVGDDRLGHQLLEELNAEGCDTEHVTILEDTPTDRGVILVSGGGSATDRTILWVQGARLKHGHHLPVEQFFAKDLVIADVDDPRLRLFLLDLPMHVSPRTRIFGTLTFLTELEPWHALELALRHDYLSGNAAELVHATGEPDLGAAFARLQQEMVLSQVRFAAISEGPNGCHIVTREDVIHLPAFQVDVIDPTGAGDAFAAGIAYGILERWELAKTGRFANALGALAIRELGARSSLPTLSEVEAFMKTAQMRTADARDHTST